jgi:predicted nucleic acid-binding protein
MKHLVDSDYVADYLKGRTKATDLLNALFPEGIAISINTFAEVYEGIYYGHNRTHYQEIFQHFLKGVNVFGITRSIAKQYALIRGELGRKGQLIDQPDLFIAATAIRHNLTLVSRNTKVYQRIPDLKLYQAS